MMHNDPIALVGGVRTAVGSFGGALKDVEAADLGAACIRELIARVGIDGGEVEEVVMGQVAQVGPDAYNARRCALGAGLPPSSTAMNVNRLCSSGLQAIVSGAQSILAGQALVVAAGGDESMSRQPFLTYGERAGWRLGSREAIDGTLSLLTDPFGGYQMGVTAEKIAEQQEVSREQQDAFALLSQRRAAEAIEQGRFDEQIVPIEAPRASEPFARDEHPRATTLEQLAALKPVFQKGGSVTAGNSSGINDGAAAVLLMRLSEARERGLPPRLLLRSWAVTGIEPEIMGYAPAMSIPKALELAGKTLDDIDIIELNEAFAAQAVAVAETLRLPEEKLNPDGGAIALGHPVGATGAILTVKLMHALERAGAHFGLVSMCIGGGQGFAAVFERP
ncbi:MAG TPA: thiolase family protein [Gaiellales bacterium]|nr:thiolase family protein [Gaiellales bacterium]